MTQWTETDPFPHLVIDNWTYPDILHSILAEWPVTAPWQYFENQHERKRACNHLDAVGPNTVRMLNWLNEPAQLDWLTEATGIPDLVADPEFVGGGLHEILPGGYLDVHADFNIHPTLRLHRRLNALLYLNVEWQGNWGSELELWDEKCTHARRIIQPIFNRLVVFPTTDTSFHGHPEPLACPSWRSRRSLAWYFYSQERPIAERSDEHSTIYPGDHVAG